MNRESAGTATGLLETLCKRAIASTVLREAGLAPRERAKGEAFLCACSPRQWVETTHIPSDQTLTHHHYQVQKAERMKSAVSFLKDIPCKVHTPCPLIFYWPELSHVASTARGAGSLLLGTISAERAACPGHQGQSFLLLQPMAPSRQRYKNK